jgi:hypothetical protein
MPDSDNHCQTECDHGTERLCEKGCQIDRQRRFAHDLTADRLRSLAPNWDSYGAKAVSEPAIAAALKVLESTGQLTPCSDGGVQIDWPGGEISFGLPAVQPYRSSTR